MPTEWTDHRTADETGLPRRPACSPLPLRDIRVLDLSQMLAGPLCAMRLADLGADVIKVEPPSGEFTRHHGFAGTDVNGRMTSFLGCNRGKRSLTLDLKQPLGLEVLHDLARWADVVVVNFRVGTPERLGIGYEQLRRQNEALIYAQISGYGEDGPYRHRPGQDLVVQGYSGSLFSVGSKSDPPTPGALWAADVMSGYQAVIGILAALHDAKATGRGCKVSVNLLATLMDCQIQELVTFLNCDVLPERTDVTSAHAMIPAPYGVFATADSWITLAMAPVDRLADVLDEPRLKEFTQNDGMVAKDTIQGLVAERLRTATTGEWLDRLLPAGMWAGPVYNYRDLSEDRQVTETGMLIEVEHPEVGAIRMPAPPIRFDGELSPIRRPPPELGEHSDDICFTVLGYDNDRVAQLHREKVM